MSWIFAYFGKQSQQVQSNFNTLNISAINEIFTPESYITFGGNKETVSYFSDNDLQEWVVSGIGIVQETGRIRRADKADWINFLNNSTKNSISGHYVCLAWEKDSVRIYTDKTGLRDVYYCNIDDSLFVSTRLDLLARFTKLSINFYEFSTRWILFNQISHNSIVNGCTRLTAGRGIKTDLRTFEINEFKNEFNYPTKKRNVADLSEQLETYFKFPGETGRELSLSLSGGLDSRMLLSILKNKINGNWDTHTFGADEHPDSRIAKEICKSLNIPHSQINLPMSDFDKALKELNEYTTATLVNNPASSILQLRNYNALANADKIVMDGGFGEIWRREFLFKLGFHGTDAINAGDAIEITKYMKHFRADIFIDDLVCLMENSAVEQVKELVALMPSPDDAGRENWLDFLAIKTRLPNYYGHEQARLDDIVIAMMPFAQVDTLELLFSYPVKLRQNGKLFRQIITSNCKQLNSFPLVKGVTINPFRLTSLQSRIYTAVKKKISRNLYSDNRTDQFLGIFRDYIHDVIDSIEFNNADFYNHNKIKKLVAEYYGGNTSRGNELDWFLSFEIFRRNLLTNTQVN